MTDGASSPHPVPAEAPTKRDSVACAAAAVVVSWRHTCPQPEHR